MGARSVVHGSIKPMRMGGEFNGANNPSLESEPAPTRHLHFP
jgi:hypothetical protein